MRLSIILTRAVVLNLFVTTPKDHQKTQIVVTNYSYEVAVKVIFWLRVTTR